MKGLVPVELAALALGVKPVTVRAYFRRGKLTRHGTERRALVDLAECEKLLPDLPDVLAA